MMTHEMRIPIKETAVAATFANDSAARAAYDLLRGQGFEHVWLATTKPADGESNAPRAKPIEARSVNAVTDSSEGVFGAIGRFFSGEGNSLRRSLEDHGVDPVDANEIDDALPPLGAVVTVFAADRTDLAAGILRNSSTQVYLPDLSAFTPLVADGSPRIEEPSAVGDSGAPAGTTSTVTSRVLVDAAPVAGMPGALEQVFVERHIVAPTTTRAADVSTSMELNDLL